MLYTQNGRRYHCRPGELFIIHKHANTRMELASEFSEKWTIAADGKALAAILNALNLSHLDVIQVGQNQHVEQIFQEIFAHVRKTAHHHASQCSILLYKLLLELSQCHAVHKTSTPLMASLNYMDNHLEDKLSIAILAEKQCVSPQKCHEMFQRHLGCSPLQLIIPKRMERARQLLRDTNLSIKEIAHACGYPDPLYFSAVFKRCNQQAPTQFRTRNRH